MSCHSTNVEPSKAVFINGHSHAGLVTHKCSLEEHSTEQKCKCKCGAEWVRNYK